MKEPIFSPYLLSRQVYPLFTEMVPAGFPSPADDYLEKSLDLNEHLIQHPAATFLVKASGESMTGAGIYPGDILIVDRSLEVAHKDVVLAVLEGEFTVKRFMKSSHGITLAAENPHYPSLQVSEELDFEIWGIVIHVIHSYRR